MDYRFYFLDADCRINTPSRQFVADDDIGALETAWALYRSSSAQHHGFELWQDGRHIHTENC
jgi:hypothetical protein